MKQPDGTIKPEDAWNRTWNDHLDVMITQALTYQTKEELYAWMDLHPMWTDANKEQIHKAWSKEQKER